jgi:hypothetical protein
MNTGALFKQVIMLILIRIQLSILILSQVLHDLEIQIFSISVHLFTAVYIIAMNIIVRASYLIPSLSTSRCKSSLAYGTIYRITGVF